MRGLKASRRTKGPGYDLVQVCAPATTRAFLADTGSARLFSLPNVGHGFAIPRNWEPQFLEAYRAIASANPALDTPRVSVPEVQDLPLVEVPATIVTDRREMAIGLGTTATFEFHVAEWVGQTRGPEYPTVPEVERLTVPVTCVVGASADSACGQIRNPRARVVTVGAGHHFSGEHARLVDAILERR